MRCGSKCFIVQYEENGQLNECEVNARTPVEVRKIIKNKLGQSVAIKRVQKK